MENDTEQKQTYLRENILNKGYSADEFMSFLNSKKGEKGLDLGNWSLEELEQTVSEFIEIKNELEKKEVPKKKNEKQNIEKNIDKINEIINKNKNLINDQAKKEEEYLNNNQQYLIEPEFIQSNISESTDISETSGVQVKLSSPEKVEGGMFGK